MAVLARCLTSERATTREFDRRVRVRRSTDRGVESGTPLQNADANPKQDRNNSDTGRQLARLHTAVAPDIGNRVERDNRNRTGEICELLNDRLPMTTQSLRQPTPTTAPMAAAIDDGNYNVLESNLVSERCYGNRKLSRNRRTRRRDDEPRDLCDEDGLRKPLTTASASVFCVFACFDAVLRTYRAPRRPPSPRRPHVARFGPRPPTRPSRGRLRPRLRRCLRER